AIFLRQHLLNRKLRTEEAAAQVDRDNPIELLHRDLVGRDRHRYPSVVDHDVETAVDLDGPIDSGLNLPNHTGIDLEKLRDRAIGPHQFNSLPPEFLIEVGNENPRPLTTQLPRRGTTDPTRSARDNGHLAGNHTAHTQVSQLSTDPTVRGRLTPACR